MKIVLMGPQGSGKGTQAEILCKKFGIAHISTGDLLRENIDAGTPLGKKAKEYVTSGALVPSDVVLEMIKDRLSRSDCKNGCLFDGYPRAIDQAEALETIAAIDKVIYLHLDEGLLKKRIANRRVCEKKCGGLFSIETYKKTACDRCGAAIVKRKDDEDPGAVAKRLAEYEEKTAPLIGYYENKGLLVTIDATQEIPKVAEDIIASLKK